MAHQHNPTPVEKAHVTSLSSAFWFALLLTLLFIAGVNFVKVMSNNTHEGHGAAHATHETHAKEATSNQTLSNESGTGQAQETTTPQPADQH